MRAYKVTAALPGQGQLTEVKFVGSLAEVTKARQGFVDQYSIKSRDTTYKEVDIPTSKPDLLAFINALL